MSKLSVIDIEFEDGGRLTCIGYLDTMDAEPDGVAEDGSLSLFCPSGFKVTVIQDGEIRMGDQTPVPLLSGTYHSTDCGLLTPEGAPVHGSAPNQG